LGSWLGGLVIALGYGYAATGYVGAALSFWGCLCLLRLCCWSGAVVADAALLVRREREERLALKHPKLGE
jgi:predicted MFS family arabinose efflux permease